MEQTTLQIERVECCDVFVCGGGLSGFAAAVAAARSGARVILAESGNCLGGTATEGLVAPFMTCYDAKGETQIIHGLFDELLARLTEDGGAVSPAACPGGDSRSGYRKAGHIGVTPFLAESLKRVTEAMCLEAGVTILYHTMLIGCTREGDRIRRAYLASETERIAVDADMFIDTTGYATLAAYAGAETTRGDEHGMLQTATTFFLIDGVDKGALDAYMDTHTDMRSRFFMDEIEAAQKDGSFPCGTPKLRIFELPDGTFAVNMAQIDEQLCELDTEAVSLAEIAQRAQIKRIVAFLREKIVGLSKIRLVATASAIGIRESRRIVGNTVFTLDDILAARMFDDRIAICANSVDIHQKNGVSYSAHNRENYSIPLSCLIAKDVKNLLTAGKSLSADKYAFAAVRVMPPCIAMGEAVGITAAFASSRGVSAEDVPYADVRAELRKRGAYLG